jgi:hypothetical protein
MYEQKEEQKDLVYTAILIHDQKPSANGCKYKKLHKHEKMFGFQDRLAD